MEIDKTLIEKAEIKDYNDQPLEASVVVVTYNTYRKLLKKNLNSLSNQSYPTSEIIIVDNSDKKNLEPLLSKYSVSYIKLKINAGLSIARNIATFYAKGDIIIFLDDDAIPAPNLIEEHVNAHKNHAIAGLRGKSLPRTNTIYNFLADNYDLGENVFPYYINLEGNSSFKKDILNQLGGFFSQIKGAGGYEGAKLSYRILNFLKDRNQLIYYPKAIIFHDNCGSFFKYLRKKKRHLKYKNN